MAENATAAPAPITGTATAPAAPAAAALAGAGANTNSNASSASSGGPAPPTPNPIAAPAAPAPTPSTLGHAPAYVAVEGGYASVGGPGFPPPAAIPLMPMPAAEQQLPAGVAGVGGVPMMHAQHMHMHMYPGGVVPGGSQQLPPGFVPQHALPPQQQQQQGQTLPPQAVMPDGGNGSAGGGSGVTSLAAAVAAAGMVGTGTGVANGAVGGAGGEGAVVSAAAAAAAAASAAGIGAAGGGSPNGAAGGGGSGKKRTASQAQSKPQSAWMLFIQDRREQVKLDNPDIAVTQQQKIMSEIWKTMSGDEREAYRSRARDDQKRYKAEQADKPAVKKEDFYGNDEKGQSTELVCPLGRIGRIIKLDQDVQSVTKEATALIGKAMELFTALIAKEAFAVSQSQNRRLLKLQDITDIMHNQDQFYWIKDDFPLPPR